jgi:8-oxo-dGTP diphosphatase
MTLRPIEKVGLALIRAGRLLVVRNAGTTLFIMPGGQREDGESSEETLAREIKEELSCDLDRASLQRIGVFLDSAANHPGREVRIELYAGNVTGGIAVAGEIAEMTWFEPQKDDLGTLSKIVRDRILPELIRQKRIV